VEVSEHATARETSRYGWYVVSVLLAVYMVHHLDRMVVSLLLDPIGKEFQLSDSQLGLLAGLAYAIPFAIAGIPLGMLVDRVNRVRLLTVLVTVWSALTALAAFATGFWTLLLARIGVAAAESGGTPTNISIISDQVPATRRATALGVYYMGTSLGTIVGFSVAGAVATSYGWRAGFLVAGLPGLLLAVLLWRTVREPPRSSRLDGQTVAAPRLLQALRIVWSTKSALHVIAGSTIMGMFGIGLMTWLPALMIRNHGASLAAVGAVMAFAISPLGAVASLIGGRSGDVLHARGPAAVAKFLAVCALLTIPAAAYGILSASLTGLVVGFAIQTFVQVMMSAPAYATVIHHVPTEIRGVSASVMQVSSNVLGFGVGTQVIGLASDALRGWSPGESLRYAMLAFCAVNLWAVLHFLLAARAMHDASIDMAVTASVEVGR
jgi:predicted MFS family arabinose efflux permease